MDRSFLGRSLRWLSTPSISPIFLVLYVLSVEVQRAGGWLVWAGYVAAVVVVCVAFERNFGRKVDEQGDSSEHL